MATRAQHLKQRYGITLVDYDKMLEKQDCKCKICGAKDKLVVDHCHDKGHIRGLLCQQCNTGLGMFRDDVNRMRSAMQYLTCSGEWLPVTTVGSLVSQG